MNKRHIALLISLLATSAVFILYYFIQPLFSYFNCPLCDGNQYASMYGFFHGDISKYQIAFPYYSRVIVPFLANLMPFEQLINNFQLLNLIFSLLFTGLILYIWREIRIPYYLIIIGLGWLLLHWPGIIRLNTADPLTVDVPTYFIQGLFILIFITRKFKWLWILAPVAVFQKESFNALLIALLIYSFYERKHHKETIPLLDIAGPLLLSFALKFVFTVELPPVSTNNKTALETVILNLVSIIYDPLKILRWLAAALTAFGPLLILGLLNIKSKYKPKPLLDFLSFMSMTYLALGLLAGGDMTRIIFLGFPFIMTWILMMLKEENVVKVAIACILSIIVMRITEIIPDPGKDFLIFASWFPEYADVKVVLLWVAYFIFCFLLLFQTNRFLNLSEKN